MHKKIFIELPVWLGDAVMATPAIANLQKLFPKADFILLGSSVSIELFRFHDKIERFLINDTKKSKCRFFALYKLAKDIGKVDVAISFRRSLSSKFMMAFINAKQKYQYQRLNKKSIHQVIRYNDFINHSFNCDLSPDDLFVPFKAYDYKKPTLGLNPGASYGSAKRWYPKEFAKIAIALHEKYDIVIFGGKNEKNIANDIEKVLQENNIKNYQNLVAKTSIKELCEMIGGLSFFITNDSGPMHIASAYKVPTITIFGPTSYVETDQWNNPNKIIISKNLSCAPCQKRKCPLKHHDCMKSISSEEVLEKLKNFSF